MDKVIIDGVDVNKCGYYKDGDCLLCPVTCEEFIDCDFKEIKRLQAENEQIKKDYAKLHIDFAKCNEENEQLKKSIDRIMQNKEIKTIDLDIAKENVELKEQLNRKDDLINDITNGGIQLQKECEELNKELDYYEEKANKYFIKYERCKQALQEIKKIAEKLKSPHCTNCTQVLNKKGKCTGECMYDYKNNILDKINEVIGAE